MKQYVEGTCMACHKVGRVRIVILARRAFRWCDEDDNDSTCEKVVIKMAKTHIHIKRGLRRQQALPLEEVQRRRRSKRDKQSLLKEVLTKNYLSKAQVEAAAPSSSLCGEVLPGGTSPPLPSGEPATKRQKLE